MKNSPDKYDNANPRGLYGDPWVALYGLSQSIRFDRLSIITICAIVWGTLIGAAFLWGASL